MTAPKEIWACQNCFKIISHHKNYVGSCPFCNSDDTTKYILATHTHTPEYLSTLPAEVLEEAGWVRKPSVVDAVFCSCGAPAGKHMIHCKKALTNSQ